MQFDLSHGDIAELARRSEVPHETVRRYVNGGEIRASAARKIDAAAKDLGLIHEGDAPDASPPTTPDQDSSHGK